MLTTLNPKVDQQNLIINPCMKYWRRATSFNNSYAYNSYIRGYTADRWCVPYPIAGTTVVSRQSLSSNDAMVSETPQSKYYLRYAGSHSSGEIDRISQGIEVEDHDFYEQKWMTLSFWAKTNSGNPTMHWALRRFFDEDNWANGGYDIAAKDNFQLTTTWQKFVFTFKTSNVTASPSQIKYPNLRLDFIKRIAGSTSTGYGITSFDSSSFNLDITNVKLEFGTQVTPLIYDKNSDLYYCNKWFQTSYGESNSIGTTGGDGIMMRDIYNNNTVITTCAPSFISPVRFSDNTENLGGSPTNSRLRFWAQTSATIDRTYAQSDGIGRVVTSYTVSPYSRFQCTVSGSVSAFHQIHYALCLEYWY